MQQVLFRIPIRIPGWLPDGLPLYGFGLMLFVALVVCGWVAARRAEREGIKREYVQDLAIMLFFFGILGARITFLVVEVDRREVFTQFFRIWDGGLVFYGSVIGGIVGYLVGYFFIIRKHGLSSWQLADIFAPTIALGLVFGRLGCFLNGCCFGGIACSDCPKVHFPFNSPPCLSLAYEGLQTPVGFAIDVHGADPRTVLAVEPTSAAAAAGLRPADLIVKVNDRPVENYRELENALGADWPRGRHDLALTVLRSGKEESIGPFWPKTMGLHPAQVYSSIGAFVIFLLLLAYVPVRRRYGEVMVLLMLTYPIHRFLVEAVRNDTERFVVGGWWPTMTFSQNVSILLFILGLTMALWMRTRPVQFSPA